MMIVVDDQNRNAERIALRAMFEARKRVFIDLLRWNLPVLADRYEVDQFDDGHAIYLILAGPAREHLASCRLLPTTRPGILNTLYPQLSDTRLPQGEDVYEITRFCLSRDLKAADRRRARDTLVRAIAHFGIEHGIRIYTGVAEIAWLQQILAFGWRCAPLGLPQRLDGRMLGALRIDIEADTLERLAQMGAQGDAPPALAA